jgi:hypothetical protein
MTVSGFYLIQCCPHYTNFARRMRCGLNGKRRAPYARALPWNGPICNCRGRCELKCATSVPTELQQLQEELQDYSAPTAPGQRARV